MQDVPDGQQGGRKPSRAVLLLRKAIATRRADRAALAVALAVSVEMVGAYETSGAPMPLEEQESLATFVIDHIPALARAGHTLRGQVAAALDFKSGRTSTHNASPPGR